MTPAADLVLPIGTVLIAVGAFYRAGRTEGDITIRLKKTEECNEKLEARCERLEASRSANVARHEFERLDARLDERLDTLEGLVRSALTPERMDDRISGLRHDVDTLKQTSGNLLEILTQLLIKERAK